MTESQLHPSWQAVLKHEFDQPYYKSLVSFVNQEYATQTVFPPSQFVYNSLNFTHFEDVKAVILGQDPYHGPSQANGLCFSVNEAVPIPPSLRNIYTELSQDLGIDTPLTGNLERWARQGVLLLNATMTVRAHEPGSHQNRGWEQFTDAIVQAISRERKEVVFMLWGNYAQQKGTAIDRSKHLILKAPHPSPLSAYRGFFGCRHFSKANAYMKKTGKAGIDW